MSSFSELVMNEYDKMNVKQNSELADSDINP